MATLAHAAGAKLVVDNVFATPIYQSPLSLGADIATYSTTKHIDGQGRMLGGAVLGSAAFIEEVFLPFYRQTGAAMSPFNAWVALKSLKTLHLRVDAQTANSHYLANRLAEDSRISCLRYPGHPSHPQYALAKRQMSDFSSLMAFELEGKQAAFAFLDSLSLIDIQIIWVIQSHLPATLPAPPMQICLRMSVMRWLCQMALYVCLSGWKIKMIYGLILIRLCRL